jgi:hypothetical protein
MENIYISVKIRTEGKRIMIVGRVRGTRQRKKKKKKNAVREARVGPDRRRCVPSHHLPTGISSCKVAAASCCRRRSSATSSRCIILLRRSPSVMGSSSRDCPSSALDISLSSGRSVLPRAVRPTGQVKHSVPVRRPLDFVLSAPLWVW